MGERSGDPGPRRRAGIVLAAALALGALLGGGAGAREARAQGEMFVSNDRSPGSITVYSRSASGDVAPVRTISGGATGLNDPIGLAVDPVHDEVLVANFSGHSITVYSRTASGNVAPLRTLVVLSGPRSVAVAPQLYNDD